MQLKENNKEKDAEKMSLRMLLYHLSFWYEHHLWKRKLV
jgi:hypothetical protein